VLDGDPSRDVGPIVRRLTAALTHRGPDGQGYRFIQTRCAAFGHRRLSIVDVAGGAQPMGNEDGRLWVVVNGELYNHLELRRELERAGHHFKTKADTEVLVHGWEAWGPGLLARLNGIYAFALFDGRRGDAGDVWLARDPVGVKPLYIGRRDSTWWFSSELGAARSAGLVCDALRSEAVEEFLVYRFVPSPGTLFRDAWKVPPGHLVRLSLGSLPAAPTFVPFDTGFAPASLPGSTDEWAEAVAAGVSTAVRRQLMSDVPVGVLLSGGVDSTVVARLMRDAAADPPLGFAIGFEDVPDVDELTPARAASSALGLPLKEAVVSERAYLEAWPAEVAALGEPIANTGLSLVGLLCREVRKERKVVLSGQGADEPLGGYPRHAAERWYPVARRLRGLIHLLPDAVAGSDRLGRMRRVASAGDESRRFAEILAVFSPQEAASLTGHPDRAADLVAPVQRWLGRNAATDGLNRLLYVDTRLSLADDLLIVADHLSMAQGVELRVPFLDLELLALVEQMPSRYKVSGLGERKWLYRRAIARLLPPRLRPDLTGWRSRLGRKLGFTTPLGRWFARWVQRDADQFLTGPQACSPQFMRRDGILAILQTARRQPALHQRQLASLFVLEVWLRGLINGRRPSSDA
jgi:asparagine synthase (glutamine-hydrolysing)